MIKQQEHYDFMNTPLYYISLDADSMEFRRCDPKNCETCYFSHSLYPSNQGNCDLNIEHWLKNFIREEYIDCLGRLEYKGYVTHIRYSASDRVLYGKIEGINDLVNFESDSAKKIEKEFHKAVDDYLDFCKQIGKEPEGNKK